MIPALNFIFGNRKAQMYSWLDNLALWITFLIIVAGAIIYFILKKNIG